MFLIMRMIVDIFGQIFRTLWAHKLRSFLTMFGVAWGVGSLLLLVGLGEGFRSGNKRGLAEFGRTSCFSFPAAHRRWRQHELRAQLPAYLPGLSGHAAQKLRMYAVLRRCCRAMTCTR